MDRVREHAPVLAKTDSRKLFLDEEDDGDRRASAARLPGTGSAGALTIPPLFAKFLRPARTVSPLFPAVAGTRLLPSCVPGFANAGEPLVRSQIPRDARCPESRIVERADGFAARTRVD